MRHMHYIQSLDNSARLRRFEAAMIDATCHRFRMPDDPTIVLSIGALAGEEPRQVGRIVAPHDPEEGLYPLLLRAVRRAHPGAKLVGVPHPDRIWETACHMGTVDFRVSFSVPPYGMANRRYASCRAVMLEYEPPVADPEPPAPDIFDLLD